MQNLMGYFQAIKLEVVFFFKQFRNFSGIICTWPTFLTIVQNWGRKSGKVQNSSKFKKVLVKQEMSLRKLSCGKKWLAVQKVLGRPVKMISTFQKCIR